MAVTMDLYIHDCVPGLDFRSKTVMINLYVFRRSVLQAVPLTLRWLSSTPAHYVYGGNGLMSERAVAKLVRDLNYGPSPRCCQVEVIWRMMCKFIRIHTNT